MEYVAAFLVFAGLFVGVYLALTIPPKRYPYRPPPPRCVRCRKQRGTTVEPCDGGVEHKWPDVALESFEVHAR